MMQDLSRYSVFLVGLDLGKAQDPTAVAVVEYRVEGDDKPTFYHVRHLEQLPLGTTYPDIGRRVRGLMGRPPLKDNAYLVADATGVGAPVIDLLYECDLYPIPVTITGGDEATRDKGHHRVPKRDLVSAVQVLLQTRRLKVAEALPEGRTLERELRAFEVKVTATAHDTYNARVGAHDDLVLAVALACWYGEQHVCRFHGPPVLDLPQTEMGALIDAMNRDMMPRG